MRNLSFYERQVIVQWLALASLAEFFIFIFPKMQALVLLLIAAIFFVRFLWIMLNPYGGRRETLNLDLLSLCLTLTLAAFATGLRPSNILLLILTPTLVLPHIIYIFIRK
jgi:hypothetical protein